MSPPRWVNLGLGFGGHDGLFMRDEEGGTRVSQAGLTTDKEIAAALSGAKGGTWTRNTEWSAASGENDVTALWARLDTIPSPPPDAEAAELPIPKGEACRTVLAAMSNLVTAVIAIEKLCMALARQLDGEAP